MERDGKTAQAPGALYFMYFRVMQAQASRLAISLSIVSTLLLVLVTLTAKTARGVYHISKNRDSDVVGAHTDRVEEWFMDQYGRCKDKNRQALHSAWAGCGVPIQR